MRLPLLPLIVATALAIATRATLVAQAAPVKSARAVRLSGPAPRIDGQLDDLAWQRAAVISDFDRAFAKEPEGSRRCLHWIAVGAAAQITV